MNWGGQEYRILEEVRWLRDRGHAAWIACDPESELMKRAGAEFCVPMPMAGTLDWLATRAIRRFCREQGIDVIHTHSSRDSWVCYPLHVAEWPVVRSRQITNLVRPSLDRSFIYRHGCARVVASADCIRRSLVEHTGVAAKRVDVIGEGVDLGRFNPDVDGRRVRAEWGIGDGVILFGLVAMIRPEKGHVQFIEAALELVRAEGARVRFAIIGEGVGDRAFEQECRRRLMKIWGTAENGPVFMAGYRRDVPEVMAALDVLVVPSLAEAQSIVTPQAFATGRPVIASRVGGLPELVTHEETGLLVEPGDVGGLAQAMRRLADDEALRAGLGTRALALARSTLSFHAKMAACVALYENVAARRRESRQPRERRAAGWRVAGASKLRRIGRYLPRAGLMAVPMVLAALVMGLFFLGPDSWRLVTAVRPVLRPVVQEKPAVEPVLRGIVYDTDDEPNVDESVSPSMFTTADDRIIG